MNIGSIDRKKKAQFHKTTKGSDYISSKSPSAQKQKKVIQTMKSIVYLFPSGVLFCQNTSEKGAF